MSVVSGRNSIFKIIARGVTLDQYDDEDIFLSNNVTGLFDIGKLPSDFTRQITLPGTKRNNEFFEHVYDISVDEPFLFKTNEKVIAQFDFDGFYVAQGYMQLENVVIKENKFIDSYTVSIFGLLSSFSRDLQSTLLTDLDPLQIYDHTASYEIIEESMSGSMSTKPDTITNSGSFAAGDIIYPIVDYGEGYTLQASLPDNDFGIDTYDGGELNVLDFKPAIRINKVIDAIFEQSQYTYESEFLSSSFFDNQYVLCDNGNKRAVYDGVDLNTEGLIKVGPISGSSVPHTWTTSGVSESLDFQNVEYDPSLKVSGSLYNMTNNMGVSGAGVGCQTSMTVKFNFLVSGSDSTISIPQISLFFKETPQSGSSQGPIVPLDFMNEQIRQRIRGKSGTGEESFTLEQKIQTTLFRGHTYDPQLFISGYLGSTGAKFILGPEGNSESYLEITKLNEIADFRIMRIKPNMPYATKGISSLEFLQGVQKKYNLQIYPSKTKPRHFIIKQFNDWYKEGKVVSFDRFIDLNKKIKVIPANNLGVRNLEFGDTLDLDFISQDFNKTNNREYGKTYYTDTENFFSQGQYKVESEFSSSPLRYVGGTGAEGTGVGNQGTLFYANPASTSTAACSGTPNQIYYHNGSFTYPEAGDRIFTDINLTIPATTINYFYVSSPGDDLLVMNPGSATVVTVGSCIGGGGPTS